MINSNINASPTVTIELDVAYDGTLAEALDAITAEVPTLTAEVLTLSGPTGWPFVRFEMAAGAFGTFCEVYGIEELD